MVFEEGLIGIKIFIKSPDAYSGIYKQENNKH
jgi:hypothetical protein